MSYLFSRKAVEDKKKKIDFEFVRQTLDVLALIEQKLIAHAATDIISALQHDQNLLGNTEIQGSESGSPERSPNRMLNISMQKVMSINDHDDDSENDITESFLLRDALKTEKSLKGQLGIYVSNSGIGQTF